MNDKYSEKLEETSNGTERASEGEREEWSLQSNSVRFVSVADEGNVNKKCTTKVGC